ncbi:hypothetical protein TNCV_2082081 [Trichonephila clavipes]|nr:hypothetical protein TNCV_2082081 [Trichonephila clavipes]
MKTLVVLLFLFSIISAIAALPLMYSYYGYPAAYGYAYDYAYPDVTHSEHGCHTHRNERLWTDKIIFGKVFAFQCCTFQIENKKENILNVSFLLPLTFFAPILPVHTFR